MKVQYFGNFNDYGKFALLRLLSTVGSFRIGVCWMLTKADGSGDGDKRGYLNQPKKWRAYDPPIFDALTKVPTKRTRNYLRRFEAGAWIPGAAFFSERILDPGPLRHSFHARCMAAFGNSNLTFLDPDIGLEVKSYPKGRKRSSKYSFLDEIADHYEAGRSVLLYRHYPRNMTHEAYVAEASDRLRTRLSGASIWLFETPHVAFVLAARPDHVHDVEAVVAAIHDRRWLPNFFTNVRVAPSQKRDQVEAATETQLRQNS
jgi:hypothetical protein